jgi:hypothetical protein
MSGTNKSGTPASADQFLWAGPRLLVPVTVEALVVTTPGQSLGWQYNANQYAQMRFFGPIEPTPFSNTTSSPPTGVTLHWALPDAITHGVENAEGEIEYPAVPNRWLVTRSHANPQTPGSQLIGAWVVQSDFLGSTLGSSFPDPFSTNYAATRLGHFVIQEEWKGEIGPGAGFELKAIGPGDATFTASVASIKNVFSFQDPLAGFESGPLTYLTYTVAGWYAAPPQDPLYGAAGQPWTTKAQWLQLMEHMKWSVGSEEDLENVLADAKAWYQVHDPAYPWTDDRHEYPAQTLCQGMLYKVKWEGKNAPYQSGVPTGTSPPPKVAIGNTAIDALAALVEYRINPSEDCGEGGELAELLEAFQYNLLSSYEAADASAELPQAIFNAWFSSASGGILWEIVESDKLAADLTPAHAAALASLNSKQSEVDALQRQLSSLQWELYALWWKIGVYVNAIDPPPGITLKELRELLEKAKPVVNELLTQTIPRAQGEAAALETQLRGTLPEKLKLVQSTASRFTLANDPVILINGAHRSYKHGESRRFTSNETVFTRFTGQSIRSIEVEAQNGAKTSLAASDLGWSPVLPNPQWIPKEVFDLLVESFFLDTFNAGFIAATAQARLGQPVDANRVARQQTIIWNPDLHTSLDRRSIAELSGLRGTIPSKLSVNLWAPPWSPLYMQWQVTWHPSSKLPQDALKKWKFDGLEYQWNSSQPDVSVSVSFMGRTLLTPESADEFGFRLQQFIDEYMEGRLGRSELLDKLVPKLKDLLDNVVNWDLLSQSMSGFSDYLLMRNPTQHIKPDQTVAALIGPSTNATPHPVQPIETVAGLRKAVSIEDVGELIQILSDGADAPARTGAASGAAAFSPFFPIRAGHFQLQRLWIVDDFGQVFNPIGDPGVYAPIRGQGLCTAENRKLLQLPPRLAQPCRLLFEQVSASDDSRWTSRDPTANPVCGWILNNYLDRGVTVYDAQGEMLGSLNLAGNPGRLRLRWNPAPGSDAPLGSPPAIPNDHLRGFVNGLLGLPDAAAAFQDFLAVVDSTLWTLNPWAGRVDQNLSVLVGHPLAMVRAQLEYQLRGRPAYDQSWKDTGKDVTNAFEAVDFQIKLGSLKLREDGLLGYFLESDYQKFGSVHPLQSPRSDYIVQKNVSLDLGARHRTFVSMLLDPRGVVHAANGIMPVKKTGLAAVYVDDPLTRMEVTFRTGPLLTDPATIRMPAPADIKGKWSWIQRSGVTLWEDPAEIVDTHQQARLGDAPAEFVDGWLKLSELSGHRDGRRMKEAKSDLNFTNPNGSMER